MSDWRKRISEDAGPEHARRVFESAEEVLAANERQERKEQAQRRRGWLLWLPVPAAALAALALAVLHVIPPRSAPAPVTASGNSEGIEDLELASDFDVILNVHEIEQFRLVKELGNPERWKRKNNPKKKS